MSTAWASATISSAPVFRRDRRIEHRLELDLGAISRRCGPRSGLPVGVPQAQVGDRRLHFFGGRYNREVGQVEIAVVAQLDLGPHLDTSQERHASAGLHLRHLDFRRQQRIDPLLGRSLAKIARHQALHDLTVNLLGEVPLHEALRHLALAKAGQARLAAELSADPCGLGLDGGGRNLDLQLLSARADLFDIQNDAHRRSLSLGLVKWCERGDSNPQPDRSGLDPKSSAYTSSATFATTGSGQGEERGVGDGEPRRT